MLNDKNIAPKVPEKTRPVGTFSNNTKSAEYMEHKPLILPGVRKDYFQRQT